MSPKAKHHVSRNLFGREKRSGVTTRSNNTITLNSTVSEVIDSSLLDVVAVDKRFDFIRTPKSNFKKTCHLASKSDLISVEDFNIEKTDTGNTEINDDVIKRGVLTRSHSSRYNLRRSTISARSPGLEKSPLPVIEKEPVKTYLTKSKKQNIEKWLNDNNVSVVSTPPFSNLSGTSLSVKKTPANKQTEKNDKDLEKSVDAEVEEVLVAVYGDDWRDKNVLKKYRTEPKRRTPAVAGSIKSQTTKKSCKMLTFSPHTPHSDMPTSSLKVMELGDAAHVDTCQPPSTTKKKVLACTPKNIRGVEKLERGLSCTKTPKRTFLASLSVSTPTSYCHPEAQEYKINFKSKKEELCKKLFKLYNNEIFEQKLPEDMSFTWNPKMRGTAGFCYNRRVVQRSGEEFRNSRIVLSTKIVDRADRLRDTLIHELCHAASWIINGALDGHGCVWLSWAARARDRFPELPVIKTCHNYEIASKYTYRCTGCGYSINRHSKSINTERKRCGYCYGVLELLINKKRPGKTEVPEFDSTRTLRTPNDFALFVKEHYQIVKARKSGSKHAEIMKALGQEYAKFKGKKIPSIDK